MLSPDLVNTCNRCDAQGHFEKSCIDETDGCVAYNQTGYQRWSIDWGLALVELNVELASR